MTKITLTMKDRSTGKEVIRSIQTGEAVWTDPVYLMNRVQSLAVGVSELIHLDKEEGGR